MELRDLLIERILFVLTEEELAERYLTTPEELATMAATDLLELYEDCFLMLDGDECA
jgi:hypothetical protein